MNNTFKRLTIIFQKDSLGLHEYEDSFSSPPSIFPMNPDYWSVWREGHLAFGGLLGKITFFTLKKKHNSQEIG